MPSVLFSAKNISKRFAVPVLESVDFEVLHGEIHGLIGANGAGKSTLCKIIAGLIHPDSGEMQICGDEYQPKTLKDAMQSGIQIVHQELSLVSTLTVSENIFLGELPTRIGVIQDQELQERTSNVFEKIGLTDINPSAKVATLGAGEQQLVQIAIALARDSKLLILDEPTTSLNAVECDRLFRWLRVLKNRGIGIVFISHRLKELTDLADRITVLRDGVKITTAENFSINHDRLLGWITGEKTKERESSSFKSYCTTTPALQIKHLADGRRLTDVSLTLHRGERLGIAGLVGSGRTELLHAIFGETADCSGTQQLFSDDYRRIFSKTHVAAKSGIGLLPEDRKSAGLMVELDVKTNLTVSSLWKRFTRFGVIQINDEIMTAETLRTNLKINSSAVSQSVETLSGGNQQKVAIGKWLITDAEILLLDEPTRGIDAAARRSIYDLMQQFVSDGKSIIMVSSDLHEMMEICDRIAVLAGGRITETFDRTNWNREAIVKSCFHTHQNEGSA